MSYPISQPVYPGSLSHQQPFKPVTVIQVQDRVAICRDAYGKFMEVRADIMRAKGNLPAPGEQWMIDQQYGVWTFGAIITGGTNGVEIPPENVTGLPEVLTATDNRITTVADNAYATTTDLEARSIGRVTTKGDLIVGTGNDVVDRLAAGVNNQQVLVPDSTLSTGVAWKTPLALPQPLTGATAAGRYVGQTSTGTFPATGTFLLGDWIRDANGYIWVCTTAGSPGGWTCAVNNRFTAIEGVNTAQNTRLDNQERFGKHFYTTSGPCASFGEPVVIWPSGSGGGGIGTMGSGSGIFTPNRVGRWSFHAMYYSDGSFPGWSQIWFRNNQNQWGGDWIASAARATGYGGAGRLWVQTNWTGYITVPNVQITVLVSQASSDGGTIQGSYWFSAEFLGGP